MTTLFAASMVKKALATPEQIDMAIEYGQPFTFHDEVGGLVIKGFILNGVRYVTEIE